MTRICCNTADDQPHVTGCPYAIGNAMNRPCPTHRVHDCPICATSQGENGDNSASPSTDQRGRARDHGPFRAEGVHVLTANGLMVASCSATCQGSLAQRQVGNMARQIADGLNMLRAVRAGTAGKGAAAPLGGSILSRLGDVMLQAEANENPEAFADALARHGLHIAEAAKLQAERQAALATDGLIQTLAEFIRFRSGTWHGDVTEMSPADIVSTMVKITDNAIIEGAADRRRNEELAQTCVAYRADLDVAQAANRAFRIEADEMRALLLKHELAGSGLPEPEADAPRRIDFYDVTSQGQARRFASIDLAGLRVGRHDRGWSVPGRVESFTRAPCAEGLECGAAARDDAGPFTSGEIYEQGDKAPIAVSAAVFASDGHPYCFVEPDTVVGGTIEACTARCADIAAALNAVDGMTCELCHDLGNSHAPDCPAAILAAMAGPQPVIITPTPQQWSEVAAHIEAEVRRRIAIQARRRL